MKEQKLLRTILHCGRMVPVYDFYGDYCSRCKEITGNTLHGRCDSCGNAKHYSLVLAKREQARGVSHVGS